MIHTDFRKGQRLFIIRKDGAKFVDRYLESRSAVLVLEKSGRVPLKDLRSVTIYRTQ